MDYLIDTTFLVGRWRGGRASPEQRFMTAHPTESLGMPWIVKGEFLRGALVAGQQAELVSGFLALYPTVWPVDRTIGLYAEVYAGLLRGTGRVGPNDLWIAASALERGVPLLTRNAREFGRVPGLEVVDYAVAP